MSVESNTTLWEAFREDPTGDHYLPESHIVFLPTGVGAANESLIHRFFQSGAYSHPKKLHVEEKVIHRTVGVSSAVDEVEVKAKFVSGDGGWLLPGIEPHFLEDIVVTFPMVICASIEQGKIGSVRYMWDNAAVLKMARLIGTRNSWPIVAEVQVDALREPSRFRLNPYGDPIRAAGSTHIKSNISSIFNASPPTEPSPSIRSTLGSSGASTPSSPPRKGHPALTSAAFDYLKHAPSPFLEYEAERKLGSATPYSQQQQHQHPEPVASPRTKKGHPALTSQINFSDPPPEPAPRTFRKVADNIFGHLIQQQEEEEKRGRSLGSQNQPLPVQQPPSSATTSMTVATTHDEPGQLVEPKEAMATTADDGHHHHEDSSELLEQQIEALRVDDNHNNTTTTTTLEAAVVLDDETPSTSSSPPLSSKSPISSETLPLASSSSAAATATTSGTGSATTAARKVHPNFRSQISFG
ncbi:hypothetical protein BGZ73_007626 [Actinomortierella ambigua]|nr:hypothetical protein BGZ73_007626 [Actinomortierella ambigua]